MNSPSLRPPSNRIRPPHHSSLIHVVAKRTLTKIHIKSCHDNFRYKQTKKNLLRRKVRHYMILPKIKAMHHNWRRPSNRQGLQGALSPMLSSAIKVTSTFLPPSFLQPASILEQYPSPITRNSSVPSQIYDIDLWMRVLRSLSDKSLGGGRLNSRTVRSAMSEAEPPVVL